MNFDITTTRKMNISEDTLETIKAHPFQDWVIYSRAGHVPFGYIKVPGAAIPDAFEFGVLTCVWIMKQQGMTYENIAKILNHEGIPTKIQGTWHGMTVNRQVKWFDNALKAIAENKQRMEDFKQTLVTA